MKKTTETSAEKLQMNCRENLKNLSFDSGALFR